MLSWVYHKVTESLRNVKGCYISRLLTTGLGIRINEINLNYFENGIISLGKRKITMIKHSLLLYAPSGTGKTSYLQRVWDCDHHQDLAINLNRSYFKIRDEVPGFHTRQYLITKERKTPALSLSSAPKKWAREIDGYYKKHPIIKHILLDEVQCAIPLYLTHIIMLVRAIYHTKIPVIMCGLISGIINGKKTIFPQMIGLTKITENVVRYQRPRVLK